MSPTDLAALVVSAGALGAAAFGVVEALKWTPVGTLGLNAFRHLLGPLYPALASPYGKDYDALLEAQYRKGRSKGELPATVRRGVRLALSEENAANLAEFVGIPAVPGERLRQIAGRVQSGGLLDEQDKTLLARFELAVDTRIDAAFALAENQYTGGVRCVASVLAIAIAQVAAALIAGTCGSAATSCPGAMGTAELHVVALIVGVAAVPLAPIAKDLATAVRAADKALKVRA